ncbi:MAG: LamG domain-containing protein, partial [Deltaproteobacteria bacterium]|nr:LamG domain-containing protein [Deltaproteobacteria bacterium]
AVSITARVRPDVIESDERAILSKGKVGGGGDATYGMSMVADEDTATIYFYIGAPFCYVTNTAVGAENWHFVAGSYDEATTDRICYMDGLTGTDNETATSLTPNDTPLRIGWDGAAGRYFPGLIDEVALYNKALSEEEIQNAYCAVEALASADLTTDGCL